MPLGGKAGRKARSMSKRLKDDIQDEVAEEAERIAEAVWKRMRAYIRRQQREIHDEGGDDDDPWTED